MNAAAMIRESDPSGSRRANTLPVVVIAAAAGVFVALVVAACLSPGWLAGLAIALTLFFALKLATLHGCGRDAAPARLVGYLMLWPGMNARTFLRGTAVRAPRPRDRELAGALLKLGFGITLSIWATRHAFTSPPMITGWMGMVGLIFTFHFGLFHVLSWGWRRAGVVAPPLMRAPIVARSLADFWGARWNTAFVELARRFMLRPLARRWGTTAAGALVFVVSGLIHEIALSVPARGGWGGPMCYFLLQGVGLGAEKAAAGRRAGLGSGRRGRAWMLLFTAAPLPLLFHRPLLERVVVPLFRFLQEAL